MNTLTQTIIILVIFLLGLLIGYNLNNKPKQITMGNKIEYIENTAKIDSLTKKNVDLQYQLEKQKTKLPDIKDKQALKSKSREYLVDSVITPLETIKTTCIDITTTQALTINYLEQNNEMLVEENKQLQSDVKKEKKLKVLFIGTTILATIAAIAL